jgi:hypothetical protein
MLSEQGCRLPDRVGAEVDGVQADLIYENAQMRSVVLVDYEHGGDRDTTALIFGGWNVIHIGPGEDLGKVIAANPGVFGQATR